MKVAGPVVPFAVQSRVASTVPALAVAWTAAVELETTVAKIVLHHNDRLCATPPPP